MKEKEKLLFKELCGFKKESFDRSLLDYATPNVLGHLFFNRMQGAAYDRLKQNGLCGYVNREFRNSLKSAYEQNIIKNQSFMKCVVDVAGILKDSGCRTAMLKGSVLCSQYPPGYRTSNDIDLLVFPNDVTKIGNLLLKAGYRQGNIRNGEVVPAKRNEIIESKMMRGETVPYIKEVNMPGFRYSEVDINFSLDFKNGETDILDEILKNAVVVNKCGIMIPTLSKEDFFIHLCAHLYKEAATLPWVEMKRDMTLYKYCDIYMLLCEMSDEDIEKVFLRAEQLKLEKICAYAVSETLGLFEIAKKKLIDTVKKILAEDPDFVLRVYSPREKKYLIYQTKDTMERFFMNDRKKDLKEVI